MSLAAPTGGASLIFYATLVGSCSIGIYLAAIAGYHHGASGGK